MKYNSQGVLISIIILICLLLLCHTLRILYPKNKFANLPLSISNAPINTGYNKIYYDNQGCSPCTQLGQAQIPCKVVASCMNPAPTPYQLSDDELNAIYQFAYKNAGFQVASRAIKE